MRYLILPFFLSITITVVAQKSPTFGSMYFQNQYLANPAMAGVDSGITIYAVHRQQAAGMNGAPNAQAITATWQLKGFHFGVNAGNDKTGLFSTWRAAASVSYSQPLGDDNQRLHFGLSYGAYASRIKMKDVEGDMDDPLVQQFNHRRTFFDGDIGLAYTDNKLTVQASLPGFVNAFNKDREDLAGQTQVFTAVSYAFDVPNVPGTTITPKIGYRVLKNEEGIADLGVNINFEQYRFGIQGIYHVNSGMTAGLNIALLRRLSLLCMYSSAPAVVRNYTSGNMEFGLRASF